MIQAHIVEVVLNDDYRFGIKWDALIGSGLGLPGGQLLKFSQNLVLSRNPKSFR